MELLNQIQFPEDLRRLKRSELSKIVKDVRDLILNVVSEKGGHFSSNLGSVELTVALHYAFDTPRDKLVWDVGHQAYAHKILTGRKDRFSTIRQYQGLSGFTCRAESEYDHFGAGHASTSISAALGIAEGMRHKGESHLSVAVIGDGSLSGGLAYEALNNAGHNPAKNLVVVFNDNDMSIDPSVGALSKFINQTVTHPGYNRLREEVRLVLSSLDEHGVPATKVAQKVRRSLKNFFTPGVLFECFGFRYFGPIDGHNVQTLVDTFEFIKKQGPEAGPYLVHVLTKKGKGYKLAEEDSLKYHGVNPFRIEEGIQSAKGPKKQNYQDVFADTLIRLAKEDPRIIAITAAMPSGTGLAKFQKEFPNRTYDVGIAEAHAVLFGAGLATEGFRPVVGIYSTFLQRAYDQIIHDVAIQNLPVIFAMDRAGLVGADGVTHQGAFDLSYLRCIPNIVIMAPRDENELQHAIKTAVEHTQGPFAFRYPRGEVAGVPMDEHPRALPIGKGEVLVADAENVDVAILAVGVTVQSALAAQSLLRTEGVSSLVMDARFIKPLDEKLLLKCSKAAKCVVTLEENTIQGGFGSAVLELLARHGIQREVVLLGMPDTFVDHATPKIQRELCGLDAESIFRRIFEVWKGLETKKAPAVKSKKIPTISSDTPPHLN